MNQLRLAVLVVSSLAVACSSSNSDPAPASDGGPDTRGFDAAIFDTKPGPFPDAPPPDDAPAADTSSKCVGSGEPCGDCMAANCCDQGAACAADKDCQAAALCLATACTKSFDECAVDCNTKGNATFTAYAACADAKGCASKCK
jgi:hypothetical protein